MAKNYFFVLLLSLLNSNTNSQTTISVFPDEFASGLNAPTEIVHAGDDCLFVCEKTGLIKIINPDGELIDEPFLDISDRISDISEQGLLGLAFHPDYSNNGYFFVFYTNSNSRNRVLRFTTNPTNPNEADLTTEKEILLIDYSIRIHHGGCLRFDPHGYLCIAVGDASEKIESQNDKSLLGNILRIDIDKGDPYAIPDDNPYVGYVTKLEEVWMSGLRNPWKFSFDRTKGDLWIADVGERTYEEINHVKFSHLGGQDFGWPCYEGRSELNSLAYICSDYDTYSYNVGGYPYDQFIFDEFDKFDDYCGGSITGGYVYRGPVQNINDKDLYISADFCTGQLHATHLNGGVYQTIEIFRNNEILNAVSTIGEDFNGNLYAADFFSGKIYKLDFSCPIPKINISVASCETASDGCINLDIPSELSMAEINVSNVFGDIVLESDYCNLESGRYSLISTPASPLSECTKTIPFTIEYLEPDISIQGVSCELDQDGCIKLRVDQITSDQVEYYIQNIDGDIIDSSDYCNVQAGIYQFVVENPVEDCDVEYWFEVQQNVRGFGLNYINDTLYSQVDTLIDLQWVYRETFTSGWEDITGANEKKYKPERLGDYGLFAKTRQGCEVYSELFRLYVLSDNTPSLLKSIKIYPNPSSEYLNIEVDESISGDTKMKIIGLEGVIYKTSFYENISNGSFLTVSTTDLPSGLFYLLMENNGNRYVTKIIKE